jgi:ATPase subunit of ABC transporter with duplicated ATPase domains
MSSTSPATGARLVAERLTYALPDGRALFNDLTISFGRDRTGLVGANGAGKTTLLRLLAGELRPLSGVVHREGVIATLPQDFRPAPAAPVAVVLGIAERLAALRRLDAGEGTSDDLDLVGDDWDLPLRADATLARFGLERLALERPIGAVSGGEATRIALAGLLLRRPDVLLLDEPTNHLDDAGREALGTFVDEWHGGIVCVSHDRPLLRRMDRIVELSTLGARIYGGNYDFYRDRRDMDDAAAERELSQARAALRLAERNAREAQERQARREAQGKRDRANANIPKILLNGRRGQAEATGARIRGVTAREVEERRARAAEAQRRVEERTRPRFGIAASHLPAGRTLLAVDGVTVHFAGSSTPVLDRLSLQIVGPERVALVGRNGSGKTTLLRVALGELAPDAGTVRRVAAEEIASLDQHGVPMDPSRSALEIFRAHHPRMEQTPTRHALARFLFSDEAARQRVDTLSGGQRLRLSLACVLGGERVPSLLVLDEPTNHLDLETVVAMERALRDYDGALLVASHDQDFLARIGIDRYVTL